MAGIADKKVFFLVNPTSGGGKCRAWWEKTLPEIAALGLDFFWEYSEGADRSGAQARRAVLEKGAEAIVVAGGDGALYEVLNGIIEDGRLLREDLIFVVSPAGSACDFARFIYNGKRCNLQTLLQTGRVQPVDIGCCSFRADSGALCQRYYLNSCDAGAGADTCIAVNAEGGRIKRLLRNGQLSFMLSALSVLFGFRYTNSEIEADGVRFSGEYIIMCIGNGRYSGGSMQLCPKASLTDGKLDLLLAEKRSLLQILRLFLKVYSGNFLSAPRIFYQQAKHVSIHTKRPIAIELDGEVPGTTELEVHCLPGFLPLLFPDPA